MDKAQDTKKGLKAGDKIWYISMNRHAVGREVTIKSVGRKWITLVGGDKVELDNFMVYSGDYYIGHCYLSEADYERITEYKKLVDMLRIVLNYSYRLRDDVTPERVRQAAELLGITLKD